MPIRPDTPFPLDAPTRCLEPRSTRAGGLGKTLTTFGLPLLLVALALVTAACGSNSGASERPAGAGEAAAEAQEDADARVPVAALPVRVGAIESVLRYSTNLEAESRVEVFTEASRQVVELLVEEGQWVRKGAVLARLQKDEQETALAKIDSQLAKAEREYARQKRLFEQELISEKVFNEATYELEQLQLAREDGLRELGFAAIKAPISGVVTERKVSLGDYVQRNQHLFDIVDFNSIVARIYVPEKELRRLERGQLARISSPALGKEGQETREAHILRIAPTIDSQSGTVKVTLSIDDKQGLRPGMFVEVGLVADRDEEALLVPKRALVLDEDETYVYRVIGSEGERTVERLRVRAIIEDREHIKISDELSAGDLVVVAGQAGLKQGAEVRLLDLEEALATFQE